MRLVSSYVNLRCRRALLASLARGFAVAVRYRRRWRAASCRRVLPASLARGFVSPCATGVAGARLPWHRHPLEAVCCPPGGKVRHPQAQSPLPATSERTGRGSALDSLVVRILTNGRAHARGCAATAAMGVGAGAAPAAASASAAAFAAAAAPAYGCRWTEKDPSMLWRTGT